MANGNNIPPEGKKIVTRKLDDGSTETVIRDDPNYGGTDCWVATAYYGHPLESNVVTLRNARNYLIESSKIGFLIVGLNSFYYAVGRTQFGKWWKKGLIETDKNNSRKLLSRFFLSSLLYIEKICKIQSNSNEKGNR